MQPDQPKHADPAKEVAAALEAAARDIEGKSAFTTGPWRNECFAVYSPEGRMIFHTGLGLLPPNRSEEAEANARLIAAAPDLFAACKSALAWIQQLNSVGRHNPGEEARLRELEAVVSKAAPATGGAK